MRKSLLHVLMAALCGVCLAQEKQSQAGEPQPAAQQAQPPSSPAAPERTRLNLSGQTNTASGESRRNENVPIVLIDNNAQKELNVRVGATATVVPEFSADSNYFAAEYGVSPSAPLHVSSSRRQGLHGRLYETHQNSIFSARSFFQVGGVRPARENQYGFEVVAPLWRGASFSSQGSQQKVRGVVNGNVLIPLPSERTPLTSDPARRQFVERLLSAFPSATPNRPDINERMLNTNAPQSTNGNQIRGRLDQLRGARDRFTFQYSLVTQQIQAFQHVVDENPDTDTRSHSVRTTWERQWNAGRVTRLTAGYDRVGSFLRPEKRSLGVFMRVGHSLSQIGDSTAVPLKRAENMFRYAGQLAQVHGQHNWTGGFDLLRRQVNGYEPNYNIGTFYFRNDFGLDAITNLRWGQPTSYTVSVGNVYRGYRNWDIGVYAGDKWQVRQNLSLNFAVRYQPVTRPSEVNQIDRVPYSSDLNNLAPVAGFAYRSPPTVACCGGPTECSSGRSSWPHFRRSASTRRPL